MGGNADERGNICQEDDNVISWWVLYDRYGGDYPWTGVASYFLFNMFDESRQCPKVMKSLKGQRLIHQWRSQT